MAAVVTRRQADYSSAVPTQSEAAMTVPSRMKVIAIKEPGGPEMLVPQERDVPKPGAGEILVQAWPPRASTSRTCASARAPIRRPRARPIFRAWRSPVRLWPWARA